MKLTLLPDLALAFKIKMFAKIFTQILDSSLAEDWQARVVFEDLLKLCDINGVVDMTHEAIARRTNVPQDIVKRGIAELEKPDPRSRNPEHEGRRIVRLDEHRDWGWLICNYAHYRAIASDDQRREKTKERTRKWRERNNGDAHVTHCDAVKPSVTHGSAGDAMQKQRQMEIIDNTQNGGAVAPVRAKQSKFVVPSLEDVKREAEKIALPVAEAEKFFNYYESNGWKVGKNPMKSWQAALRNWHRTWDERGQSTNRRGVDRSKGTLNEGRHSDYADIG